MSRTVITAPDGSKTVITRTSGCGGCFWFALAVFVVLFPAAAFPRWAAIVVYIFAGLVVLAWGASKLGTGHPAT
jgi:hypothetical protein